MTRTGKQRSAVSPLLWAFALAAMLLAVSMSANTQRAHAAEPLEEGGTIVFGECSIVSGIVQPSDAAYTNVFWRFGPDVNLGVTSADDSGTPFVIGQVPANTELILGIKVQQTGNTFVTGPGSRNDDGAVHARVSGLLVEFEDVHADDGADWDYNDAVVVLSTEPCPRPVTLNLEIDPASTGTGGVAGGGSYELNQTAHPSATASEGSTFGGWSGDCGGFAATIDVLMDKNRTCFALFEAAPVEPTPTPTPEPPVETAGLEIAIDNTLTSLNPARVGEDVTFRVDVGLTDAPAGNQVDVQYTFDDSELAYVSASSQGFDLSAQCSLSGAGVIDCDFGTATIGFSYDLTFEALVAADDSTTLATLSSDPDGDGADVAIVAGPADADVDIIVIAGPPPKTGDGSIASTGSTSLPLMALLGTTVLATVAGAARLRSGARS